MFKKNWFVREHSVSIEKYGEIFVQSVLFTNGPPVLVMRSRMAMVSDPLPGLTIRELH
jgi:hypothetical protein